MKEEKPNDISRAWMSGVKPSVDILNKMNDILLKWRENQSINVEIKFITFGNINRSTLNPDSGSQFQFEYPFSITQSLLKMIKEREIVCMASDLSETHFITPFYGICKSDKIQRPERRIRCKAFRLWSQPLMVFENISVRVFMRSGCAGMEIRVGKIDRVQIIQ